MNTQLNCLVIEDDPADYELLEHHLRQPAPGARCRCVATLPDLKAALAAGGWDVVISDYIVPGLEFADTIACLQSHHPEVPLILVSGTLGEERTVELLQLGVADYVLKGNLKRLLPAIERCQRDAATRRERVVAEERYRSLFDHMLNGFAYCRMRFENDEPRDFRYLAVNQAFASLTGLKNVVGRWVSEVIPGFQATDAELLAAYGRVARSGIPEKLESYVASLQQWFAIALYCPAPDHFVAVFDVITARKQAEAALRQSEVFNQAILDSVNAHIAVLDGSGKIIAVNARWQEFARVNAREANHLSPRTGPGTNYLEICRASATPDSLAAEAGITAVITGRQERYSLEYPCHSPAENRWFVMDVTRLGAGPEVVVAHANITERKLAEEALRKSELQFRAMFETVAVGMSQTDPRTGQFLQVNRKMCAITGYPEAELLRLRVPDITHPEDREHDWQLYQSVVRGDAPDYRVEKRYLRKDGSITWVSINMTVIRDAAGQPLRTMAVVEDIADRRLTEEKIAQEQARFKLIFDSVPIGIAYAVVQPDGGLQRITNLAHLQICGLTAEQDQQTGIYRQLTHPEDYVRQQALADQLGPDRVGSFNMEKRYQRLDGRCVWVVFSYKRQRRPDGGFEDLTTVVDITERKLADVELRTSRSKLDAALASMTDAVFISDATGEVLEINEAFATFHKFPSKSACSRRLADYPALIEVCLPNGELVPLERWAVPRALRGETVANIEYHFRRQDTGETWVGSCSFSPIRDAAGGIVGAVVVGRDITARKQEEQTQRLTQFALEHSGDAIWWLGPDGRFLRANPAASRLIGYSIGEIQTLSAHDLNPAHPPAVWARHWAELREKKTLKFEAPARTKDGRLLTVEVTANYLEFEGQEFNCAFVHDITERKARTEELLWKTAFLEALVHSSADGILVVDNQLRKILQNQKVVELWALPPAVAANPDDRQQFEFVKGQVCDPVLFEAKFAHIQAHPEEVLQDELELKSGTLLSRQSAPVRGQDGRFYGRLWTIRDITQARQLEAQYRQAQKMEAIGTLAGGIAHDFNNILCAMYGYGYLAQQEMAGHPRAQEHLAEIFKAANRAQDLVQQILTFSRQREQKREVIRLATVVKEAVKLLRASLPANLTIEVNLEEAAPAVLADPTQIYQVVMNLGTNALHAMEGGPGRLVVSLAAFEVGADFHQTHPEIPPGGYARLTVIDNGQGMDARTREHIFEPFFTTKAVGKGTGLGLAVVHGIVQAHQGFITVASQPGQGATFDLFFPAQTEAIIVPASPAGSIPQGQKQRILFIDDEPDLTGPFQTLLERLNYQVTTCNVAREALRLCRENPHQFDVVISDLTMPELSGLELARELHALRGDLPVILATGHAYAVNADTLQETRIAELLEKPLSLAALARALQRVLAKPGVGKP